MLATLEPEDDPVASKGEIEVPSPEALRLMGLDKVDVGILEERTAMREMLQKRKREGEDGEVKGEGEVKKQKRPRNLRRRVDALSESHSRFSVKLPSLADRCFPAEA